MSTRITVYAYTPDLERTQKFYEGALGVRPADHGDWLPFALDGGAFALHRDRGEAHHDAQRFFLSFRVDDIDGTLARFRAQGAKIVRDVVQEEWGKRAVIEDPDGRAIELVQELPG